MGRAADIHPRATGPQDVILRYLGAGVYSTRSLRTGRAYTCSGAGAQLAVDPQDTEYLLLTRQFARR